MEGFHCLAGLYSGVPLHILEWQIADSVFKTGTEMHIDSITVRVCIWPMKPLISRGFTSGHSIADKPISFHWLELLAGVLGKKLSMWKLMSQETSSGCTMLVERGSVSRLWRYFMHVSHTENVALYNRSKVNPQSDLLYGHTSLMPSRIWIW